MKKLFSTLLATALLTVAVSAQAVLQLKVTDGDQTFGYDDSGSGFVFGGGLFASGWQFSASGSLVTLGDVKSLDLNSLSVTRDAPAATNQTLTIMLSSDNLENGTEFSLLLDGNHSILSGSASITWETWLGTSNNLFETAVLISDYNSAAQSFGYSDWGALSLSGKYSLTHIARVTHTGVAQTSFDGFISVPTPATLSLLGLGLILLGVVRTKKS